MEIQPRQPQSEDKGHGLLKQYIAQQTTTLIPALGPNSSSPTPILPPVDTGGEETREPRKKPRNIRFLAIALSILLALILFFTWHTFSQPNTSETIASQTFTTISSNGTASQVVSPSVTAPTTENHGSDIQVYIVGAVKHPGVYTLPSTARMYQLLQAAGGPQANANLVAINLAAKLSDGQEVYVAAIGESPPAIAGNTSGTTTSATSTQQKVNINTASNDELRQNLHIASTTAQSITNYRLEHGNFTSVDQLLDVVSKSIYDKIKDQVTIS